MNAVIDRDPARTVAVATKMLEQLIGRGVADAVGLCFQNGELEWRQERITGPIREWLRTPGYADAIAIDLRTPGEAVLAHSDVLCRMRYARDRIDFTVHDLVCDGPAMHQPGLVATLEHFVQEHRP